jgi:hypothetical protein
MSILQVSGEIVVKVDGVLFEQTCINHANEVKHLTPSLQAMAAALHDEQVSLFQKQISKSNFVLEFVKAQFHPEFDAWWVTFKIIKRKGGADDSSSEG